MTVAIATYCPICHTSHDVEVPIDRFILWKGGLSVQEAFPDMPPEERERLISGICPECWDKLFPVGEED